MKISFITSNVNLFNSLKRLINYKYGKTLKLIYISENDRKLSNDFSGNIKDLFGQVDKIYRKYGDDSIFLIDEIGSFNLAGTNEHENLDNLLSDCNLTTLLVLAFPEAHFVSVSWGELNETSNYDKSIFEKYHFLNISKFLEGDYKAFETLLASKKIKYTSLFDPSGFRNYLKQFLYEESAELKRNKTAVVIDDESAFSILYGYTAYSQGFKVWLVKSYHMFEALFKEKVNKNYSLSIEDIYLNYNDKPENVHLSNLEFQRDKNFKVFQTIPNRIFITVGHTNQNAKASNQNKQYLEKLKLQNKNTKMIYKPVPSSYGLIKIFKKFKCDDKSNNFNWPIKPTELKNKDHSSPGKILEIAEFMIERSENMSKKGNSLNELLVGALIAREAQELLANSTPTVSLRALTAREDLEVSFECKFHGIEYNLNVRNRINEIYEEIKAISKWYKKGNVRDRAELNAKTTIIGNLALKYREFNQFEEENIAVAELRKLEGKSILLKYPFLKIFYPFRLYLEKLLSSALFFVLAISFWILFFAIVWFLSEIDGSKSFIYYSLKSVEILFSFSIPFEKVESMLNSLGTIKVLFLLGFPLLIGFIHLGIFITHLYNKFLRR